MLNLPENKKIILFDGICNLCNSSVQKIIKADKKDEFRFTSLDSDKGKEILEYIGVDRDKVDSIILYQPGDAYYIKSEAALKIANSLGGKYTLYSFFKIFPTALLNCAYDYIATNRYKWWGKTDTCMIPTTETNNKFL